MARNPPDLIIAPIVQTLTGGVDAATVQAAPGAGFRLRLWSANIGYRDSTPARNAVAVILTDNANTTIVANWRAVLGLKDQQPSADVSFPGGVSLSTNSALLARMRGTANDQIVVIAYVTIEAI
jgi:hypothetical protein